MAKKFLLIIFTLLLCAIFAAWDLMAPPNQQITIRKDEIYKYAPLITFTDIEGAEVSLTELRGKVVLLNFWATWCPPCVKEMPDLITLAQKNDIIFIAASVDRNKDIIPKFFDKLGYPELPSNTILVHDPRMLAANAYGTNKFPESYIINKNGQIVKKITGVTDWFSDDIKALLTE